MTIWSLIRLRLALWVLKAAWKVTKWLVTAAVLAAAAPVTITAAVGFAGAWLRGWPPARLYRAALWSLTGTAAYLIAAGVTARTWHAAARWPVTGWDAAFHDVLAGRILTAAVRTAPLAVPAGLAATTPGSGAHLTHTPGAWRNRTRPRVRNPRGACDGRWAGPSGLGIAGPPGLPGRWGAAGRRPKPRPDGAHRPPGSAVLAP